MKANRDQKQVQNKKQVNVRSSSSRVVRRIRTRRRKRKQKLKKRATKLRKMI